MATERLMDRRLLLAVAAGLVAVWVVAACGEAAASLEGTAWTLASYGDPGDPTPMREGTEITLAFDAEGKANGNADCNSYFGSYTAKEGEFTLGPVGSTMMACEEPVMQQETAYLQLLDAVTRYKVSGDELQITTPDGQVLNFKRAT